MGRFLLKIDKRSNIKLILNIFKDKLFLFVFIKYLNFIIGFIRALYIAKIMGPYYLGIWGYIKMINEYLSTFNFGIPLALNVELAKNKNNSTHCQYLVSNSFFLLIILLLIYSIIYLFFQVFSIEIGVKYNFSNFFGYTLILSALIIIQQSLSNIYRVYDKLASINLTEFVIQALPFSVIFIFSGFSLVKALLIVLISSYSLVIIYYIFNLPIKVNLKIEIKYLRLLLSVGLPLFISNISFYLIMLISKAIVSKFMTVSDMGLYSFSASLTGSIFLGIKSIQWAILPKLIGTYSNIKEKRDIFSHNAKLELVNSIFSAFIIFFIICLLPLLFMLLPKYKPAYSLTIFLLIAQLFISFGISYSSYFMAKGYHRYLGRISFISLIATLLGIGINLLMKNLNFVNIALCIVIGYGLSYFLKVILFIKHFKSFYKRKDLVFFLKQLFPIILTLILVIYSVWQSGIIVFILFLLINISNIKEAFIFIKKKYV